MAAKISEFALDGMESLHVLPPDPVDGETLALLDRAIEMLPERLKQLVRARMGGATLAEVGQTLGVTRERSRQLQLEAHRYLLEMIEEPSRMAEIAELAADPLLRQRIAMAKYRLTRQPKSAQ
jgi:hypothetical protein